MAIEDAATDYAGTNEVAGQISSSWDFSDEDRTNGYIEYVGSNKLRLFAPKSTVDFWLAPVVGLASEIEVSAVAAAEIRSPGRMLPFFLSEDCAWGGQIIIDPAPGHDDEEEADETPALPPVEPSPSGIDLLSVDPDRLQVPPNPTITITGNGQNSMRYVTRVAFVTEAQPAADPPVASSFEPVEPVTVLPGSGSSQRTQVVAAVPPAVVSSTNTQWWVRVFDNGHWSAEALPFTVGTPTVTPTPGTCVGVEDGNFGTLRLSRDDVPNGQWAEENVANGIQHEIVKFPNSPVPENCIGATGSVRDNDEGNAINCLETEPGSPAMLTRALITGTQHDRSEGRLRAEDHPTNAANCPSGVAPADREIESNTWTHEINDDLLSCFFTNDDVTVGDVGLQSGAPLDVISDKIFASPRFFYLPVLKRDPEQGHCCGYAVLGLLPAFLSGQADDATRIDPQPDSSNAENGVEMDGQPNNSILRLRVRVINPVSLPGFTGGTNGDGTIPYIGSGTKVVTLVE